MSVRFLHTADLHLGKTYRGSPGETERALDFFRVLASLVEEARREAVDFVLIAGDLFHTGQILPRTFARTIELLQPLKDAGIPCVAVEGNHDWIHRRDRLSWMEALSQMGYLRLLRPARTESGGYRFDPFDADEGSGGRLEIGGLNLYGLGYIGAQAGSHVPHLCEAVPTQRNLLLFHVGIWTYSPVEIGNMHPAEAAPLAEVFDYVALGHGHKPYVVEAEPGRPYAFNPGAPECVNFGEQRYEKGYYLATLEDDGTVRREFRATRPRPMLSAVIDLDGAAGPEEAIRRFREETAARLKREGERPVVELKLTGRVGFHPFELGRDRLLPYVEELLAPLHIELRNHLSLHARAGEEERARRSLGEIEREVLGDLIATGRYPGREEELIRLALALRDRVLKGDCEGEDLLDLLEGPTGEACLAPTGQNAGKG